MEHQIVYSESIASYLDDVTKEMQEFAKNDLIGNDLSSVFKQLNDFARYLLLNSFQEMGAINESGKHYTQDQLIDILEIVPQQYRLFESLLEIMARAGYVQINGQHIKNVAILDTEPLKKTLKNLGVIKEQFLQKIPEYEAFINLIWICTSACQDILKGKKRGVDVIFPKGSLDLVTKIYKDNKLFDAYNQLLAETIKLYVKKRLEKNSNAQIKILEIGAGTGGTSTFVMDVLKEFSANVVSVYTDISPYFVKYGRKNYGKIASFMEFKVLNIEKSPLDQGVAANSFDLIFASNVIHATQNITNSLCNTKVLLKKNGLLLLNEMTSKTDFSTLTFGLTDGWWLFDDAKCRINGAPLLTQEKWQEVMEENGIHGVTALRFHPPAEDEPGINIIIGESDGIITKSLSEF